MKSSSLQFIARLPLAFILLALPVSMLAQGNQTSVIKPPPAPPGASAAPPADGPVKPPF